MYPGLLHTHSLLRYIVLALLITVIIKSWAGMSGSKTFTNADNKFSLYLLITTHLQLVIGLFLYFLSPFVQFNGTTMKDSGTRYWTVEHVTMMIIAVALITIGRVTMKKQPTDVLKFRRLVITNTAALVVIILAIFLSGRGLLGASAFGH